MKEYVARAMQVSYLTRDQLESIHQKESERGHLIANWNIQELFHLSPIKEALSIPDDNEALASHVLRIDKELKANNFLKQDEDRNYLAWIHALDWEVSNRSGEIMWDYAGRSSKKGLMSKLMESNSCFFFWI